jgi:hypothetical protein
MDDFPRIGLVIRHLYLWRREQIKGQEEGLKARPCLVVHTKQNDFDETEVFICQSRIRPRMIPLKHWKFHYPPNSVCILTMTVHGLSRMR